MSAQANTDTLLHAGEGFSIFLTCGDGIGIEVNGRVTVKSPTAWAALAESQVEKSPAYRGIGLADVSGGGTSCCTEWLKPCECTVVESCPKCSDKIN